MEQEQWSVKYRPTSLDDFIAPDSLKTLVRNTVLKGKTHAVLITGQTGTGKTSLARIIAHEVTGVPYGVLSPDIDERNMSDQRGIDAVRSIVESMRFKPITKRRVLIADECHQIVGPAASALLKPIETAPKHALWILCTDQPEKLLPTLLNRCLLIKISPPSKGEIITLLRMVAKAEQAFPTYSVEDKKKVINAIAGSCDFVPRQALQMLQVADAASYDYKKVNELIAGPLMRMPEVALGMAATKIIIAALMGKTPTAIAAFADVDDYNGLLNRLLQQLKDMLIELATKKNIPSIGLLMKTIRENDVKVKPASVSAFFSACVEAKHMLSSYSVDVQYLTLDAIIKGIHRASE